MRTRIKTYSAESGFVYQYVYRGWRPMTTNTGTEYVFEVSEGRRSGVMVEIPMCESAITECERALGREVLAAEKYAIAKLALFRRFDVAEGLDRLSEAHAVTPEEMQAHLHLLGRL